MPTNTSVPADLPPAAQTPTPIVPPEGWQLTWHDEFDGEAVDSANWTFDLGGGGWGNGEMEFCTLCPENARVEDGMLVIEAHQEKIEDAYYTSARLKSQELQSFTYGRIEARVKVPTGKGLWPAFWMLGSNFTEKGWPDCGEIDIMEYIGKEPDLIVGTVHGPGYSGAGGPSNQLRQDYTIADDFHAYAVEGETDQIAWFYGAKGEMGDLVLEPRLMLDQFDVAGRAIVHTSFTGKRLMVVFENSNRLEYGGYAIKRVSVDGQDLSPEAKSARVVISRSVLDALPDQIDIVVTISDI